MQDFFTVTPINKFCNLLWEPSFASLLEGVSLSRKTDFQFSIRWCNNKWTSPRHYPCKRWPNSLLVWWEQESPTRLTRFFFLFLTKYPNCLTLFPGNWSHFEYRNRTFRTCRESVSFFSTHNYYWIYISEVNWNRRFICDVSNGLKPNLGFQHLTDCVPIKTTFRVTWKFTSLLW